MAPRIYNPWFEAQGIDAVVVPMGIRAEDYESSLPALFRITNLHGALVTMPHKPMTAGLVDSLSDAARVAGACNAIRREPDGKLLGDLFDGLGFVRALRRRAFEFEGAGCMVVGSGGVGSAIACALAAEGVASIRVHDAAVASAEALATRLKANFPGVAIRTGQGDPDGHDLIVNATPLGSRATDPLPFATDGLSPATWVGDVVMTVRSTSLLEAADARGCPTITGLEMLLEQIPVYLEFFGFSAATPEEIRAVAGM